MWASGVYNPSGPKCSRGGKLEPHRWLPSPDMNPRCEGVLYAWKKNIPKGDIPIEWVGPEDGPKSRKKNKDFLFI
jgi:hypothetical protein